MLSKLLEFLLRHSFENQEAETETNCRCFERLRQQLSLDGCLFRSRKHFCYDEMCLIDNQECSSSVLILFVADLMSQGIK